MVMEEKTWIFTPSCYLADNYMLACKADKRFSFSRPAPVLVSWKPCTPARVGDNYWSGATPARQVLGDWAWSVFTYLSTFSQCFNLLLWATCCCSIRYSSILCWAWWCSYFAPTTIPSLQPMMSLLFISLGWNHSTVLTNTIEKESNSSKLSARLDLSGYRYHSILEYHNVSTLSYYRRAVCNHLATCLNWSHHCHQMLRVRVVLATVITLYFSLSLHRLSFTHTYRVFIQTKEIKAYCT